MVDLAAVSGLTAHERRMLAKMLTTVANGGVASVTNEPTATAHNRAFVDLLRDLTEAGLLTVKSGASENGTGSLVAEAETEVALEAIAAAAGAGGDDLTVAIGSAMSPEAVASRQEASAERAARIAAIQANRLPAGIPPSPGYNRQMQVVDPALAFPGLRPTDLNATNAPSGAPATSLATHPSAHTWAQAARAFAQSAEFRDLTLLHLLRSDEIDERESRTA